MPVSQPDPLQTPASSWPSRHLSNPALQLVLAGLAALVFSLAFAFPRVLIRRSHGTFTDDIFYMRALYRFYVALVAGFTAAWLAQPAFSHALDRWRAHLTPVTRRAILVASVTLVCLFVSLFLVHFGRHQFGGWDYNILIEVGWRQITGQRPFVDFVTPTPPFFNWTAALAFRLFGVTWDANLYLSALFASGALVWTFFLLRQLGMRAFAALSTSLVMQTAAMLTCCFWWYNNTTLVLAALFYLASLLLAREPESRLAQISFVLLFGVLPLTKPNIAGVTLTGCLALLLITSKHRTRILLLTGAGVLLAVLWFAALHISLPAMLATYRGIAKERGGLSTFGYHSLPPGERKMTLLWMAALCLPLLSALRPLGADLAASRWTNAAFWLFFPLAAVVAFFGIAGNGELRDVECTLLIGALALLAFVYRTGNPAVQRLTVALLCAMMASDLYTGVARLRVYTIGPHMFFEWQNNDHLFTTGFLKNLRGSETLVEVNQQVREAVQTNPGPLFFGPRLDFEYAVLDLPSPAHWASFFQPGTAFGKDQTSDILHAWVQRRFNTLVFLKGDYTFYPEPFMRYISTTYIRDDRYPRLTVYHRRPGF